jgi:hypothetical protein
VVVVVVGGRYIADAESSWGCTGTWRLLVSESRNFPARKGREIETEAEAGTVAERQRDSAIQ